MTVQLIGGVTRAVRRREILVRVQAEILLGSTESGKLEVGEM